MGKYFCENNSYQKKFDVVYFNDLIGPYLLINSTKF